MKSSFLLVLFFSISISVFAQNTDKVSFISKDFRSLEFKIGLGTIQTEALVFDFNYQHNIAKYVSAVSLTQFTQTIFKLNPDKNYLVYSNTFFEQMFGIGTSVGKKSINVGVHLLGGGRFFHSSATVKELHQPKVTVNKFLPESGLLYHLKLGRKKYYFAMQVYQPLTPVLLRKNRETNTTLTLGLGWRL